MASGIPRSEAERAQNPVGSSSRSIDGAKVSHSRASVSRWISLRTTVTAISRLLSPNGGRADRTAQ